MFGSVLNIENLDSSVVCLGMLVIMLRFAPFWDDADDGANGEYWVLRWASIVVDGSCAFPCWFG